MTDRELLELAAKAAGYDVQWNPHWECFAHTNPVPDKFGRHRFPWIPLDDDGDALRLAASLKIDIEWQSTNPFPEDTVEAYRRNPEGGFFCATYPENDYRRAIVRAAAEIGRNMP